MTFSICKSRDGQFYFDIVADNGQKLCNSETYTSKASAEHAISIIKSESREAKTVDVSIFQR